ncbi:MAG TPA: DNA (cytosine-5-)-methyltransferase, partial [Rhizomicrobium sp.]|nr:DNA (cytosine-5-)-methyltransferase [Rhizomicrobium sp.]
MGMEKAGFMLLVASDLSPYAEQTHRLNRPSIPFVREDIRKLTASRLVRAAGGVRPDIIVGGPPCQGFSTLGDKLSSDPRNVLFGSYAHLVEELQPRFVVIENVKALVTLYGGQFRDYLLETFSRLGYSMHWSVLDAADYGVPQVRKRVIFFGTRHGAHFAFPEPTHGPAGSKPYTTTWEAIGDLAKKGAEVPNHIALNHSDVVVARYKLIPEGGRLPPPDQLPASIRRGNFGNTYKRLHRKRPALTMVPGNNAFPVHPTLNRSLTPREAARLQTFPDDFLFFGDRRNQCILVGNAVPPLFGEVIGIAIQRHIASRASKPAISQPNGPNVQVLYPVRPTAANRPGMGFIDLFCGAGGFSCGLTRAGWTPLLSVDINKFAEETHRASFRSARFENADLGEKKVRDRLVSEFAGEDLGLLVGGPPCQGFSIFGKRRFVNT